MIPKDEQKEDTEYDQVWSPKHKNKKILKKIISVFPTSKLIYYPYNKSEANTSHFWSNNINSFSYLTFGKAL